ncbi:MAG: tetratricopeptide repeat protein [Bacteroidales bacterium]|nr:tetratricopeptide repeat protein [Bacteroidales bacterium]
MKIILYLVLLFAALNSFGQPQNDHRLAMEYYQDKEFDKASELFLKLFNTNKSSVYFSYYTRCLFALQQFDDAEKFIKKQIKQNPEIPLYKVSLGAVYKEMGKESKALEEYNNALKNMKNNQSYIMQLANAFLSNNELSYAELAYLEGRKLLKGDYTFHFELANIYAGQREYRKMINEYLDLLVINESYLENVQSRLWSIVYNNNDETVPEILKSMLIKKIQQNPGNSILSELLIWYYLQEKDFEKAIIQAQALDKRNKEDGYRLMSIGESATNNKNYDFALQAYSYIIEKGFMNRYYIRARNNYLAVLYEKVFNSGNYTKTQILELEKAYLETIEELGENAETFMLMIELSQIQGFYLNSTKASIERMQRALDLPGMTRNNIGKCKIMLADLLLLSGDPWEATIIYTQAEKENENNPIGDEAKYKKAKLAYYQGDFLWAKAKLDVLKASTSKFIANDAFRLSQIITINTEMDSILEPMQIFARGDFLLFQNKDSLAMKTYDSIPLLYSYHSLEDEILYRKGNIYEKNGDFENASKYYERIINEFAYDILGDDAMFRLAVVYQFRLNDSEKAKETYQKLIMDYPGSIFVAEARKQFRFLRGDKVPDGISQEDLFFLNLQP